MQLEVQAGTPVTITGLEEAPSLTLQPDAPITITGLAEAPSLTLPPDASVTITVDAPPTLEVGQEQTLVLTIAGEQGPAGPPGGGGGGEPAQRVDYTGLRYWYLDYSDHISRVDHGVSPPLTGRADSTDWAGREGLEYA